MNSRPKVDHAAVGAFLDRYLAAVFPSKEEVVKRLTAGQALTFYFGIDPTGPDIHLGHTIGLTVLKQLIDWGHRGILLVGDFTARIGDPTGRVTTRPALGEETIRANMRNYLAQVAKVIPSKKLAIRYNSAWLGKLTFGEVVKLASHLTTQQIMARDMFQQRLAAGQPIYLHEFLYPLMQGYDSVALAVDGEIGGNDQTFNMLVGRDLLSRLAGKDKLVLATRLLEDPTTGKKLMSKSQGGYISLNDQPNDFFGKVMALPDEAVLPLFKYATQLPSEAVAEKEKRLAGGENPMIIKKELAYALVSRYYQAEDAKQAQEEFERVFSAGRLPQDLPIGRGAAGKALLEVMVDWQLATSRSEAKRLLEQGAVKVAGAVNKDWSYQLRPGEVVKVGPRKFLKIE